MSPGRLKSYFIVGTIVLALAGGFFISPKKTLAAVGINKQINFQGKVVNSDGTNVSNGSHTFVFKIYNDVTLAWTDTESLTVTDGIFQYNLGSDTENAPLPGSVLFDTDNVFLGVEFDGNGEMSPRIRFTAAPYAFNADSANNLGGKTWEAPGAIGSTTPNTAVFTTATIGAAATYDPIILSPVAKGTTSYAGTITSANLDTAVRTWTFPDATGTVALTANKLSDFAATTSAELLGNISDETGTGKLTFATSPTFLTGITLGDSSGATFVLTSALSGATDPTLTFGNDLITTSGDLKITGDDLYMNTNTSGYVLVADGASFNPVLMSGDVSIGTGGVTAIATDAVHGTMMSLASEATGDTMYFNGTDWIRLAASNGGVLTSSATAPAWVASTSGTYILQNANGTITWVAPPTTHTQNTDTGTTGVSFVIGSATDAAANDITLQFGGSNQETFYFDGNGTDSFLLSDDLDITGGLTATANISIAAGLSYTGAGAVTLSSTTNTLTLNSGNNILTIDSSDTSLTASGVTTLTLGAGVAITNASGNIDIRPAGTGTANVQIGDGGTTSATPDLLVLDVGSAEPTGTVGAMYYSTALTKFRCYQGAAWADCIGAGGSSTLQSAYAAASGNIITTTDARDIAFTLADLTTPTKFSIENQDTAGTSAEYIKNSITSGALVNGLLFEQTGAGAVTNAISILETAGTVTTAINIGNNVGTGISIGTGVTTGISVGSGGITITAGALAVNSDSITSDGTLVINASGTVDVDDILNANSITSDAGVSIAAAQSYTGAGAVTLSSAATFGLTINSGTTGTLAFGDDASDETINIGTGAAIKTITFGSLTTSSITTIRSGTGGINLVPENSLEGNVQIGTGGAGTNTPDLFILDAKDNAGNPTTAIEGSMYYNQSENKFKCYQNTGWTDCIGTGSASAPSLRTSWFKYEDWTTNTIAVGTGADLGNIGDLNWTFVSIGTGGTLAKNDVGTAASDQGRFGVIRLNSPATVTTGAHLRLDNTMMNGVPANLTVEWDFATVTDNIQQTIRMGFHDSVSASAPTDGLYFQYNVTATAANWFRCSRNNSAETCTDTGIAKAAINTYQKFKIVTNAAGTQVDYYINDVLAGSNTTNLPAVGRSYGPAINANTVTATIRQWKMDYFQLSRTGVTR